MRLIDADKLYDKLLYDTTPTFTVNEGGQYIASFRVADAIESAHTLTYEDLVPHGRWVPLEYDGYADGYPVWDLWECSECREEHSGDEDTLTPYCPNCGAKLDRKNEV